MIRTVLGDVDIPTGPILAHEHLQIDLSHNKGEDNVLGPMEEADIAADLAQAAAAYGLRAVADLSVPGSGRDVAALRRISQHSSVSVIAATGFYWDPLPLAVAESSEAELSRIMIAELTHGVGENGPCCGTIKIGTDGGEPGAAAEKLFAAAVTAAMSTGASIITHTSAPAQAFWHLDVFRAAGMDLSRVLISHLHKFEAFAELAAVAQTGVFIGLDQIGFKRGPSIERVANLAVQIIQEGFGDQLILASDIARKSRLLKNGGTSYGTVFSEFLQLLEACDVSQTWITKLMQKNPRRLFSI